MMAGLLVMLLQLLPVPQDVQQECEDHRAAFRTVQGLNLVYDCERQEWFAESDWLAAEEDAS